MNKFIILSALALAALLPSIASAQTDINGDKMTTEVKIGTIGSAYSDGRNSSTGFVDVKERLGNRWVVEGLVQGGEYFGSTYAGGGGSILFHPTSYSYIQAGGFGNSNTQTTQTANGFIEAGTLVYRAAEVCLPNGKLTRTGFIKAVEIDYTQTWEGFGLRPYTTSVDIYAPRAIVYLPHGIDFALRGGVIDFVQNGNHNKQPEGGARLRFPVITKRLEATVSAGFDSEGITNIAQILNFSTRNYGAGLTFWINNTTSIEGEGYTSLYTANHLSGTTYQIVLKKRFGKR